MSTDQTITEDDEPPTVTSEPGNYAVAPLWLIGAVKPTSLVVYLTLRIWADNSTGHAFPKVATIAERAQLSAVTVERGIAELEQIGALKRVARYRSDGGRTSNSYHLSSHTGGAFIVKQEPTPPPKYREPLAPKNVGGDTPKLGVAELDPIELDPGELEDPHTPVARKRNSTPPPSITFDTFWKLAARKTGKGAARKALTKALTRADLATIAPAWTQANEAWNTWPDPSKIPHPTTWLNQDRWDDDPPQPATRPEGKTERTLRLATQLTPELEQEIRAKAFGQTTKTQISA